MTSRAQPGGGFILDAPETVPAAWGKGQQVLMAEGEPLLVCGPTGVGKTTVIQQLVLRRIGIGEPTLLGLPVRRDERRVFYVAADRPKQIARSMRRMVGEDDRSVLDERLIFWAGPLPREWVKDPSAFVEVLLKSGVGMVVQDSLKDLGVPLAEDAGGVVVSRLMQHVVAAGIEFVAAHHQRKAQQGATEKPRTLDDSYGSALITGSAGSVLGLVGSAGDSHVELLHLKQPADVVGPLALYHDHDAGTTTVPAPVDLLALARDGVTVKQAARRLSQTDTPDRNQKEQARRRLERLVKDGLVIREDGGEATVYRSVRVTPRDGSRDPLTDDVTGGHDLALDGVTHGSRNLTGRSSSAPTPLRGAREQERDPHDGNGHRPMAEQEFAALVGGGKVW